MKRKRKHFNTFPNSYSTRSDVIRRLIMQLCVYLHKPQLSKRESECNLLFESLAQFCKANRFETVIKFQKFHLVLNSDSAFL